MTLQQQALHIIDNYDIYNRLREFGEVHLVGNVAFDTTVKPDIDFQIYVAKEGWKSTIIKIINDFARLGLDNYITRDLKQSGKYLISFAIYEFENDWTIDITLAEKKDSPYIEDAYKFYVDYKDKLTDQSTKIIKQLKNSYKEKKLLKNSMSYYIYRAVLDEGIDNLNDFEKFMEKHNDD